MTPDVHAYHHDAVVLAGGGARRLGGTDKPSLTVGARTLLDRVLSACAGAATTVVVGPRRPTYRPVTWVREDPPGGGPLAGLDAGLRGVTAETVLVLSADLPFLQPETVRTLLATAHARPPGEPETARAAEDADGADGALVNDGRDQPLLAAYRTESLRRELALLHTEYGTLNGLPLRLILPELRLRRIDIAVGRRPSASAALDCDTWEDVAAARARIREHDTVLDEWMAAAKAELGVDLDVDTAVLLDLARDAAHGVARPAAPLTTFLVGYAAAQRGGSPEQVAEAAAKAARLAARWAEEAAEDEESGRGGEGEQGDGR
ncbi:NTP transferase domain-containing protein [Streptomyces nanshensis]|uniref:Molybdopterin-guanine dinucleotide biosynthesis protein n=1 Tax=Streptomyces nanshensis TaxID=518642 RepID=A0A1E7LD94_9ACTN|nr:NTP transferase domain-containing protein [Streptomyces nanshensis]OEV14176.1 molybdopterin-guanine dinucleotide biosynthesis protein [Streptomyces nanshensis]